MNQSVIQLTSPPIGQGRERTCYVHPDDPSKLIKISGAASNIQSRRDLDFYHRLKDRKDFKYTHLPRFYGTQKTSLGQGLVVDLVRDFDREISKSLKWYLDSGRPISDFEPHLELLKSYLLDNLVIFNHDVVARNLLFQKLAQDSSRLVLIDGIGDVVSIQWLNKIPSHARAKINRRWQRFLDRLYTRLNSEEHSQDAV
jgi:hypothetical protein